MSDPFTFTVKSDTDHKVLLMAAEDYTGQTAPTSAPIPTPGPLYLETFKKALGDAGIGYDVYDVDAENRTAPSALGVLATTRRSSGTRARTSTCVSRRSPEERARRSSFDDEILSVRDYLNEGGTR